MRRTIILLILQLCSYKILFAGGSVQAVPSISEVTVFLNRAQISSTATVSLEDGTSEIILSNLSSSIDPQSIQVGGKGDFIIMGVKHSMNYLDPLKKSGLIIQLEDSIEATQLSLDILTNTKEVYAKEEKMILSNQHISGKEKGITADELEDMADFFRDRLIEIRNEILKGNIKIKKISERLNQLKNQLTELNNERNRPSSTIVITVSNKSPKTAVLLIDYVVYDAGWYPLYDLRAKDTKSSVQLVYKAQVHQNTGIDWNNVKLKLSTSNPSIGGTKPVLNPCYLNFYELVFTKSRANKMEFSAPAAEPSVEEEKVALSNGADFSSTTANYVTVNQTALAAEFSIALPYTIESGEKEQLVDVQTYELPASYKHNAVPKLDKDAFLMANVTGWEEYNLVSGNANIYFEGTYIGQSFIDLQNTNDTLSLSLGRDTKVVMERKTLKEFTSKKFIGSNRKVEYAYEIVVRNNNKESIEISLEDQIPVSQNKEIEVEVIDKGGAAYDPATGKLTWNVTIGGTEAKSMVFKYSVKYPKNKTVSGL